jgi:hypothetical protein
VAAAVPSDQLLPIETQGYVSIARFEEFGERFDRTQIGQLLLDESMQPFRQDFHDQLNNQFDAVTEKLGIRWEDLDGITGGELSLAIIRRAEQQAALVMVIDMTGRTRQAEQLIDKAAEEFTRRGGRRELVNVAGQEITVFQSPAKAGVAADETIYFLKNDTLCILSDRAEAKQLLARFAAAGKNSLSTVPAYQTTMERCRQEADGLEPELRWFVEPFEFMWALRSLETKTPRWEKDLVQILHDNGYDAILGIGGFVNQLVKDDIDFLQRTFVYAPPVKGKEKDPLRWNLSMRMMQLPNATGLGPEAFVPSHCAMYSTANVDIQNAYKHVNAVADDLIGYEDAFATTIEGLEIDPYGPEVEIGKEFIAHLGTRATVIRDYLTPITPECERYVYALEATNPKALAATLDKIMDNDPAGKRHTIDDLVVWVIEEEKAEYDDFAGLGFAPLGGGEFEKPVETKPGMLQNSAACVANGYLLLGSDINFIHEVLDAQAKGETLANSPDYKQVEATLSELAPGPRSGWTFSRCSEALRPTYELIRQGKMPEAKTSLGRLLNELLTTKVEEEEGILRKQRVDGTKLPNFAEVEKLFGSAGHVIRSDDDGWLLTGALMK